MNEEEFKQIVKMLGEIGFSVQSVAVSSGPDNVRMGKVIKPNVNWDKEMKILMREERGSE